MQYAYYRNHNLDRDCARWKLTPAEVQKRRALFWELFIADCWQVCVPPSIRSDQFHSVNNVPSQSLATGRLATFSLPFVDCELPFDPDQTMGDDESIHPSCTSISSLIPLFPTFSLSYLFSSVYLPHAVPYWKARFGAECVSAVVQGTLTSRAPRYFIILELDRKVRDMELPAYAHGTVPQGVGLAQTMSHFMPTNYRELSELHFSTFLPPRCFVLMVYSIAVAVFLEFILNLNPYLYPNSNLAMDLRSFESNCFIHSTVVYPPLLLRARDLKPPTRSDQEPVCAIILGRLPECLYDYRVG